MLADQFGSSTVAVRKAVRLCLAADKNGEGVPSPGSNLLCYGVRRTSKPKFKLSDFVFIENQLEATAIGVTKQSELCLPTTMTSYFELQCPTRRLKTDATFEAKVRLYSSAVAIQSAASTLTYDPARLTLASSPVAGGACVLDNDRPLLCGGDTSGTESCACLRKNELRSGEIFTFPFRVTSCPDDGSIAVAHAADATLLPDGRAVDPATIKAKGCRIACKVPRR